MPDAIYLKNFPQLLRIVLQCNRTRSPLSPSRPKQYWITMRDAWTVEFHCENNLAGISIYSIKFN